MGASREIDADVCVVGAGIVGLGHALAARERGLRVVVLERSERAVGASVRNFGHGCLAAMAAGRPLECALATRERWIELGARAGFEVVREGTVVVAREEDELAVLEALCRDERRSARMVTPAQIADLAPLPVDDVVGGLHAALDYRVNPRDAVGRLAGLLEADPEATIRWSTPVHDVGPGEVHTARGTVRAELVFLCPGPAFAQLPPNVRPGRAELTLCKLQMLRARPDRDVRYGPALMTGLSLLRYPGYTALPEAEAVRRRIAADRPELVRAGIHLIVTQLPDGDLIIGDSHEYGNTVSPFQHEWVYRLLLEEAGRLLGCGLDVKERWHGEYPVAPGEPFLVESPLDGVHLVQVVSGIGMTTGLGLAAEVLESVSAASERPLAGSVNSPREDPGGPLA